MIQDCAVQKSCYCTTFILIAEKLLILITSALLAETLKAAFDFEQVCQYVRLTKIGLIAIITGKVKFGR